MTAKFFRTISQPRKTEKGYKVQGATISCSECGEKIDPAKDHFELKCFWKIKNSADIKRFCSLECLHNWTKDDEEEE